MKQGFVFLLARALRYLVPLALFAVTLRLAAAANAPDGLAAFSAALVAWGGYRFMTNSDSFIRGQRKLWHTEARALAEQNRAPGDPGFVIGGVRVPSECRNKNILCLGKPGSGKTLTTKHIASQACADIPHGGNTRAIIYDFKPEFLPFLHSLGITSEKITLFHANDQRSFGWAMQADVRTEEDVDSLAWAIIPPIPGDTNPFFREAARALFAAALLTLIYRARENKRFKWGLREVFFLLSSVAVMEEAFARYAEPSEVIALGLTKNSDVLATLQTCIKPLRRLAAGWQGKPQCSIREWMERKEGGVLVIGRNQRNLEASEALCRLLFNRIAENLLSGPQYGLERLTWFFLDELPAMSRLHRLDEFVATFRAYGGSFVFGVQFIPHLFKVYGQEEAKVILESTGTRCIFHSDGDTAKHASEKFIGSYEFKERNTSTTQTSSQRSHTEGEVIRERVAVLESEIAALKMPSERNPSIEGYFISQALDSRVWFHRIRLAEWKAMLNAEREAKQHILAQQPETNEDRFQLAALTPTERAALGLAPIESETTTPSAPPAVAPEALPPANTDDAAEVIEDDFIEITLQTSRHR